VRSSVNRIALGTIIGEQPWRKCSLQTRRRSSTYRLSCVRELISITRVHTRSTRDHRPMLGDYAWSCGSWSLYSATGNIPMALSEAIIATYMTIHMARSPGSHSGRIASPCQEFRKGAEILRVWLSGNESTRSFCPRSLSYLPKSRRSQRTPGPAVRATGTKRPDRSCGRWLGLGDRGMGEIFHFALMRGRVRHGALTMRLRSHVRSGQAEPETFSAPEVLTARCNAPCAGCSCGRAKPAAHACRGRRWLGHSRSHAAACADGSGIASWPATRSDRTAHGRPWASSARPARS
jgi:hypothetical protein